MVNSDSIDTSGIWMNTVTNDQFIIDGNGNTLVTQYTRTFVGQRFKFVGDFPGLSVTNRARALGGTTEGSPSAPTVIVFGEDAGTEPHALRARYPQAVMWTMEEFSRHCATLEQDGWVPLETQSLREYLAKPMSGVPKRPPAKPDTYGDW